MPEALRVYGKLSAIRNTFTTVVNVFLALYKFKIIKIIEKIIVIDTM